MSQRPLSPSRKEGLAIKIRVTRRRRWWAAGAVATIIGGSAAFAAVGAAASTSSDSVGVLPGLTATKSELPAADLASIDVTLARYAQGTDNIDYGMLASTYTINASLTVIAGGQTTHLQGRDAITSFFINGRKTQGYVERHFLTGIVAQHAPNGAALVHAYFLVVKQQDGAYTDDATGIYNDLMVRGQHGVWRIQNENLVVDAPLP